MSKELKKKLEIINDNLITLRRLYSVKKIGIFGSYARGEHKRSSDIDILVELGQPMGFFKFLELEEYLGDILKIKVDLATKNALRPMIKNNILKDVVYVKK